MLKRGPFSFISYELVKKILKELFSVLKLRPFLRALRAVRGLFLLLRALRAVKRNLDTSQYSYPDFTWKGF